MVKSGTRFGKPSWALDALSGETGEAEQAVDFQFSITWSSVFAPLPAAKPAESVAVAPVVPMNQRVPTLVAPPKEPPLFKQETALMKPLEDEPAPVERPRMDSSSTVSWEMVVPKMIRPAAKAPSVEAPPPAATGEAKKFDQLQFKRLAIGLAITVAGILLLLGLHHWLAAPKPATPMQTAGSPLKLEVEPQGNGLIDIRWNPRVGPVAQAREARLVVMERDQPPRTVALDPEQLKSGHLSYKSATERVVLRLEVVDRSGAITKESTLALLPESAPAPPLQAQVAGGNAQASAGQPAAVANAKPKAEPPQVAKALPAPQTTKPVARAFTPPGRSLGDPGERPTVLPDPPSVPSGSGVSPIHLPEPSSRISPPSVKQVLAPPSPVPAPIKVGGNLQAGKLIKRVTPVYPQMAAMTHLQGMVRLTAVIGKDGTIQDLKPITGPSLLVKAASDAVKQWVYQPTILNGQPVEVQTQIDVNFNLNQ